MLSRIVASRPLITHLPPSTSTLPPILSLLISSPLPYPQSRPLATRARPSKTKGKLIPLSGKSARGIIHSQRSTGNNVSHSKRRTRRTFKANVFKRTLYSEVLDDMVGPLYVSASGLRDIDKFGGIDNYVMQNPLKRERWEGKIEEVRKEIRDAVRERRKIEGGEE